MEKNVVHIIFGLMMIAGFVMILGAAGSSDLDLIGFNEILVRAFTGLGVLGVGYFGLRLTGAKF